MSGITAAEVEEYRGAVGRQQSERQTIDPENLRRFQAAIGEDPDQRFETVPPMRHWAYFLPTVAASRIGVDGHPLRGDFLPNVRLARRMFAGGETRFLAPLELGVTAERRSTIAEVRHRPGKAGDLVFVDVDMVIAQNGTDRVRERQTIVYRDAGGRVPVVQATAGAHDGAWVPGPVDLFRFSAVTFNSHRIHYDQVYAREMEGYPDLVVHGPFTAVKLCSLAARDIGRPLQSFAFRAVAPLFVSQPVRLVDKGGDGGGEAERMLEAIRCDGTVAMSATVR